MEYGIVYLLTNPVMPGLVKIGMTTQEDIDKRMKVSYEGEETSISALSAKLKGYKVRHIAPGAHWLYKDKLLSDIYDETYPFEE